MATAVREQGDDELVTDGERKRRDVAVPMGGDGKRGKASGHRKRAAGAEPMKRGANEEPARRKRGDG